MALASKARLRVQLAASLHMGQIHCCRVALRLWRAFSVEVFRQQVAWRTALIFGSSSVKAQLLDTFRRFRYHAAVSNSGMGADGNVILDVAVQHGVVVYAHAKLTKALTFLQSYADADRGRVKGYRAVVNCRAMMQSSQEVAFCETAVAG